MERIPVYLLDVSTLKAESSAALSSAEIARMNRYLKEEDRRLYLGSRLLMKQILGTSEVSLRNNGKPYLENGPSFSLSHSFPYVVLAVNETGTVGVDIESKERVLLTKMESYLPEDEAKAMHDLAGLWCLKEAVYKAYGQGYFDPKARFDAMGEGNVEYRNETFYYRLSEQNGFVIAVAADTPFLLEPKSEIL